MSRRKMGRGSEKKKGRQKSKREIKGERRKGKKEGMKRE